MLIICIFSIQISTVYIMVGANIYICIYLQQSCVAWCTHVRLVKHTDLTTGSLMQWGWSSFYSNRPSGLLILVGFYCCSWHNVHLTNSYRLEINKCFWKVVMLPNESKHYIRVIICIFRKLWRSCECGAINGPNGKWMCCSLILLFWDLCLVLSLTPTICFFRLTFLVAMDILNSRRDLMLRRPFFTWMVYAFYPMLILSFFCWKANDQQVLLKICPGSNWRKCC